MTNYTYRIFIKYKLMDQWTLSKKIRNEVRQQKIKFPNKWIASIVGKNIEAVRQNLKRNGNKFTFEEVLQLCIALDIQVEDLLN